MDLKELYLKKRMSAGDIASQIGSGECVHTDLAAAIPPGIIQALAKRAKSGEVKDVKLYTSLDIGQYECLDEEALKNITPISWFSSGRLAKMINAARADIIPCNYSSMPALHALTPVDVMVAVVSPMDRHGYFSTGGSASFSQSVIDRAKRIYLEVCPWMPRALTGPIIHISQVDGVFESEAPLVELPKPPIDEISKKIGELMAEEVPNGATIQMGIGAVPEAFGMALLDKKDMGIHTELLTESMIDMIEAGAVTNLQKPIHRGRTVATLAFGSKKVLDYINDNPACEMLTVDYVNNPAVIAMHPNFISVNAALEVDFYGQVCAESVGTRHVSGSGGQLDYVRGAVASKGGCSYIAFSSTAKNDTITKIKPTLTPGACVTTGKNEVDCIVTEYGIARLRGKPLSERTKALISIAHPKFREELTYEAKKQNIII